MTNPITEKDEHDLLPEMSCSRRSFITGALAAGFALAVRTAGAAHWSKLTASGLPLVRDAGFTEIAPGSATGRSEDRRHPTDLLRDWVSFLAGGVRWGGGRGPDEAAARETSTDGPSEQ